MNGADVTRALLTRCVHYVSDFWLILCHPKRFNDYRETDIGNPIVRASSFLVISLVLWLALSIALLASMPLPIHWKDVVYQVILSVIGIVLGALAVRASWYVVGGRAPFRSLLLILSYHFGVLIVWSTMVVWLAELVFRIIDPLLYVEFYAVGGNELMLAEAESPAMLAHSGIFVAGLLGMLAWWIVAWGAYRRLYGLSRLRSVISFLITSVLSVTIGIAMWFFADEFLLAEHQYYVR